MVTGDSEEKVIIFRDKQTDMHHNIYISKVSMEGVKGSDAHKPGSSGPRGIESGFMHSVN